MHFSILPSSGLCHPSKKKTRLHEDLSLGVVPVRELLPSGVLRGAPYRPGEFHPQSPGKRRAR